MEPLLGIHHVTAITSDAEMIYDFFTRVLGMRLVKKTVNQDDIHTYHLFFADDCGNPGTDMTFFDFPGIPQGTHGTNELHRTSFRVPSDEALEYYHKRFEEYGVVHEKITEWFGRKVLNFEDADGQLYMLISDQNNKGVAPGTPWKRGPVPAEYAIYGLGPAIIKVAPFEQFMQVFKGVYLFEEVMTEGDAHWLETGEGGNGGAVIVIKDTESPQSTQGYGTIHHIAFRVKDREHLAEWQDRLNHLAVTSSGLVDRFFFESLYTIIMQPLLFELATDGSGFLGDEDYESLGESLSLPPFLEPNREEIEATVRHIDTIPDYKK